MTEETLVNYELRQLQLKCHHNLESIRAVLKRKWNRELYNVQELNKYRLLTLVIWQEKYKVPLEFILETLVPYYSQKYKKFKGAGLGAKIATFCGPTSELILQSKIKQEYPDGENINQWVFERQHEIVRRRLDDGVERRHYSRLSETKGLSDWVLRYGKEIEAKRKDFETEARKESNRNRRYRGCPF